MLDPAFFKTPQGQFLIILIIFWVLPWKGIALWKAAKNGHLKWFIALLVLNTFAVLEIVYIFFFSQKDFLDKIKKFIKRN